MECWSGGSWLPSKACMQRPAATRALLWKSGCHKRREIDQGRRRAVEQGWLAGTMAIDGRLLHASAGSQRLLLPLRRRTNVKEGKAKVRKQAVWLAKALLKAFVWEEGLLSLRGSGGSTHTKEAQALASGSSAEEGRRSAEAAQAEEAASDLFELRARRLMRLLAAPQEEEWAESQVQVVRGSRLRAEGHHAVPHLNLERSSAIANEKIPPLLNQDGRGEIKVVPFPLYVCRA